MTEAVSGGTQLDGMLTHAHTH